MNNKNKILVFHHSGAIGGGSVSMLHILKTLKTSGNEIKVICPNEPPHILNEIQDMGINASGIFNKNWVYPHFNGKTYNVFDPRYQKRWRFIKNSFNKIKQIIADEKPDIVMLNSMTIGWMVACIDKNIKTICFDRETLPDNGRGRRCNMIKKWLSKMTKTVYLSEFDRINAGSHANSCVITDKVDLSKFDDMIDKTRAKSSLSLDIDKKYILYTGGMWKVKGSHIALKMMKYLNDEYGLIFLQYTKKDIINNSIKLRIKKLLGLDYEGDALKLLEGINDRVKFFPAQQDMIPFYSACDIVIFPSTKPHQAMPIYEAGAAFKPAVISDFENTKEFAKDEKNVLTFKVCDAKDLAGCIIKLSDNELSHKLSDNGREMCEYNNNLQDLDIEIKKLLKSIED